MSITEVQARTMGFSIEELKTEVARREAENLADPIKVRIGGIEVASVLNTHSAERLTSLMTGYDCRLTKFTWHNHEVGFSKLLKLRIEVDGVRIFTS